MTGSEKAVPSQLTEVNYRLREVKASLPRPRRVRIETAPNRQYDFAHARPGKNAPLLADQRPLGKDVHVMPLHEGWPWQPGFAQSNLDDGRPLRSFAAQRNDQDGVSSFTEISLIERNDQYPMADRRITQVRRPDLSSTRQWA